MGLFANSDIPWISGGGLALLLLISINGVPNGLGLALTIGVEAREVEKHIDVPCDSEVVCEKKICQGQNLKF